MESFLDSVTRGALPDLFRACRDVESLRRIYFGADSLSARQREFRQQIKKG